MSKNWITAAYSNLSVLRDNVLRAIIQGCLFILLFEIEHSRLWWLKQTAAAENFFIIRESIRSLRLFTSNSCYVTTKIYKNKTDYRYLCSFFCWGGLKRYELFWISGLILRFLNFWIKNLSESISLPKCSIKFTFDFQSQQIL